MIKTLVIAALLVSPTAGHAQSAEAAALSPNSAPILSCQRAGKRLLLACSSAGRLPFAAIPAGNVGAPAGGAGTAAGAGAGAAAGVASAMSTLVYVFIGVAAAAGLAVSVGGSNSDSP